MTTVRRHWAKRLLRGVGWTVLGLVAVLVSAVLAIWLWVRTTPPRLEGQLALPGLSAPVEVLRDGEGVPHIFAASLEDAWTTLGYLHAQDRLFQMEMGRRIARGRLAELIGSGGVGFDRQMRTFGLPALAEASLSALDPETRRALDAYAAGVNGWLTNRTGWLPPEYYLLWFDPEPWTPVDSLLWGRTMALLLSGGARQEAAEARLAARLDDATRRLITLDDRDPPSIGPAGSANLLPSPAPNGTLAPTTVATLMERTLTALPSWVGTVMASNAWALAGGRTATGAPILVNDPHLGLSAPGVWYLARIVTPTRELVGATAPGVPLHVLGHNGRIAWGLTTTGADTQDLVIERETRPGFYATEAGEAPMQTRTERIAVRFGEPVEHVVRATRHGPVVSDLPGQADAPDGHVVALQATALAPIDRTPDAMRRILMADRWEEVAAALPLYHAPVQNLFVADRTTIALTMPGRIPIRGAGNGTQPQEGWTGAATWRGFVDADALPRQVNPGSGSVWNGNNRLVGPDYPHLITARWSDPYRGRRIREMLADTSPYTLDRAEREVTDVRSPLADAVLDSLLASPPGTHALTNEARAILARWDRRMTRDQAAPLIFAAWLRSLNQRVFQDLLGEAATEFGGGGRMAVLVQLLQPGSSCAACREAIGPALDTALTDLEKRAGKSISAWRWGAHHVAAMEHPALGRLPVLNRLARIVVETPGWDDTVNRGQTPFRGPSSAMPFAHVHGAGFRAIYDLADLSRSRLMVATGQSGHPWSPHWSDVSQRWADGQHRTLTGSRESLLATGARRLNLTPRP